MLYWINKPKGILNSYFIELQQFHNRSFGGEKLGDEIAGRIRLELKNLWRLDLFGGREFYQVDTRQLRGGPALRYDGSNSARVFLQTNSSKNLFMGGGPRLIWSDDKISVTRQGSFNIHWLISNRLSLILYNSLSHETDNNQYVMQKVIDDKREYIVGTIDRKTLSSTIRAELFVTPELSFQYYGNPYASVGKYDNYRMVADSKSTDINSRFTPLDVVTVEGERHLTDRNGGNLIRNLSLNNPDFSFQEFRSNFVARWEYKTGSTIYLVWTNSRSRYQSRYEPSLISSLRGLNKVKADNAIMLKVNFWFSI